VNFGTEAQPEEVEPAAPEGVEEAAEAPDAIEQLLAGNLKVPAHDFLLEQQMAGERTVTAEQLQALPLEAREAILGILAKIRAVEPQAKAVTADLKSQSEEAERALVEAAAERAKALDWKDRPEVREHRELLDAQAQQDLVVGQLPEAVQAQVDALVERRVAEQLQRFYQTLDRTQAGRIAEAEAAQQEAVVRAYNEEAQKFISEHKAELFLEGQTVRKQQVVATEDGRYVQRDVLAPKPTPLWEAIEARMVESGVHPKYPQRYAMDFRDAYRLELLKLAEQTEAGAAEQSMQLARERVLRPLTHVQATPTPPPADDYEAMAEFMESNPDWAQSVYEKRFGRRT
jgi:hypothetical protein